MNNVGHGVMMDNRLDRIEQKLDKLTEAVSQIARVEEQILSVFKRMDRHEKRLDDQEDDIRELEGVVLTNSSSVRNAERFFWIAVSACVSLVAYMVS
jgi:septal ring factor EnvC (AmiA/AmiB activator)